MTMSTLRRSVIGLVVLVAVGAGLALLIPRFGATLDSPSSDGATGASSDSSAEDNELPQTSEDVIAAALTDGDLTYEESLLQRAYAIFDDPRLDPLFRSPVMNWEAGSELFVEIDAKEETLSKDLLTALAPFRARPNDPISIVNRPRADIVRTQASHPSAEGWIGRLVAGTNLRIWIKGSPVDLDPYEPLFSQVWTAFPNFFRYPDDDAIGPDPVTNPDGAIDFYLIQGGEIDPRTDHCLSATSNPSWCSLASGAVTKPAAPRSYRKSSAYVLLNRSTLDLDELIDTIAHELAHVSQFGYDNEEEHWLKESTATWVGYKVVKKVGRNPKSSYDRAARLFKDLHRPLNRLSRNLNQYNSWLFFFYASTELGDAIVEEVWSKAEGTRDDVDAVNAAIPLDMHFAGFTVRNWNREEPGPKYKDWDSTFKPGLVPDPIKPLSPSLGKVELAEPVPRLAARYYHYPAFDNAVRRVTVQNFYHNLPDSHVWAIKRIGADWKPPEDWSRTSVQVLCRDLPTENVSELVIIVSNSHLTTPLSPAHPRPIVISEDVGCPLVEGEATSTLRLKDAERDMDISYVSSSARLRFKPRSVQDQPGNVQYDLMATSVTWTASGTEGDCTVQGQALVNIPEYLDEPLDPTRTAWGYMNVVGKDGGDFHSIRILAADSGLTMKKTCPPPRPGDPPIVTIEPMRTGHLLTVLSQPNTHIGNAVLFRGTQNFDPARLQNNLPMSPDGALSGLLNSPARGFITPEIQRQLKEAQAAMDRVAAESGGKMVYTFEWELQPR